MVTTSEQHDDVDAPPDARLAGVVHRNIRALTEVRKQEDRKTRSDRAADARSRSSRAACGACTWIVIYPRAGAGGGEAVAAAASAERVYWYSMIDLDPAREAIERFHVDENEYHLGLVKGDGHRKPAFEFMKAMMHEPVPGQRERSGVVVNG